MLTVWMRTPTLSRRRPRRSFSCSTTSSRKGGALWLQLLSLLHQVLGIGSTQLSCARSCILRYSITTHSDISPSLAYHLLLRSPGQITLTEAAADVAATAALTAGFAAASMSHFQRDHSGAFESRVQLSAMSPAAARKASTALATRTPLARLGATRFDGGGGGFNLASAAARVTRSGALVLGGGDGFGSGGGDATMLRLPNLFEMARPQGVPPATAAARQPLPRCVLDLTLPNLTLMPGAGGESTHDDDVEGGAAAAETSRILLDLSTSSAMPAPEHQSHQQQHAGGGDDDDAPQKRVTFADTSAFDASEEIDLGAAALVDDYQPGDGYDSDTQHADVGEATAAAPNRARRAAAAASAAPVAAAAPPPAAPRDPWAALDPHIADADSKRPFRKGRTFVVLRNAALIAAEGPMVAAAAAMAEAAASGSRGAQAKDAKALMARATALSAKAAALAGAGITGGAVPRSGGALALTAAALTLHRPSGDGIAVDGARAARFTPPAPEGSATSTSTPAFPELGELFRRHRAALARGRAQMRRTAVVSSPDALQAGAAYDLRGGDDNFNAEVGVSAEGLPPAPGSASDEIDLGAAGLVDDYQPDDGYGSDARDGDEGGGGMSVWLHDADAHARMSLSGGASSAVKARELAGAFGLLGPSSAHGQQQSDGDADGAIDYGAAVARYMEELVSCSPFECMYDDGGGSVRRELPHVRRSLLYASSFTPGPAIFTLATCARSGPIN